MSEKVSEMIKWIGGEWWGDQKSKCITMHKYKYHHGTNITSLGQLMIWTHK